MAQQDVGKALQAMADDDVRAQVAAGNFEGVDDSGLTDEEREIVVGAAQDYPEASGFAFEGYMASSKPSNQDFSSMGRFGTALKYSGQSGINHLVVQRDAAIGGGV